MMDDEACDLSEAVAAYGRGETRKFDYFINKLMMDDNSAEHAETFIDGCVRLQDQFSESLMTTIFQIFTISKPWYTFEPSTSKKCLMLLVNLTFYYEDLVNRLLSHLCSIICLPLSPLPPNKEAECVGLCFDALREFFSSMPHFEAPFINCLRHNMPGWGIPAPQLFSALDNILALCYVLPRILSDTAIQQILCICFKALSDIEINSDAVVASSLTESPVSSLNNPYASDQFETNKKILLESLTDKSLSSPPVFWLITMYLLRLYPKKSEVQLNKSEKKRQWVHMCAVFRDLRVRFFQQILPIQMDLVAYPILLMFMASLRPGLSVNLLENLWKFVKDTKQPDEVRIRCMRYLADYLALSSHNTVEVVVEQLHDLAAWCVEYTYFRRGRFLSNVEQMLSSHKLFYVVFESIIYVLTFRQADLIGTPDGRRVCASLPLVQLINCPFKPLEALKPNLRLHFQTVSSAYKMNWLATVMPYCLPEADSLPEPSFTCPLSHAFKSLPVASHLHLFKDFVPSRRVLKRTRQNGYLNSHSSVASSDELGEDQPNTSKKKPSKANYFDFKALTNLT